MDVYSVAIVNIKLTRNVALGLINPEELFQNETALFLAHRTRSNAPS